MLAWRKSLGKYSLVKSDCEIPMIKDDEVLVKVLATGICGTDFGIYKGDKVWSRDMNLSEKS